MIYVEIKLELHVCIAIAGNQRKLSILPPIDPRRASISKPPQQRRKTLINNDYIVDNLRKLSIANNRQLVVQRKTSSNNGNVVQRKTSSNNGNVASQRAKAQPIM